MSYSRIWIHCVWSTKQRIPFLTDYVRPLLFEHMLSNARIKGIHLDSINGWVDHVHALINLKYDQRAMDVMRMMKGESSFWLNNKFSFASFKLQKFKWQAEYFAISVSEQNLGSVRRYIENQPIRHQDQFFEEEMKHLAFANKLDLSGYDFD